MNVTFEQRPEADEGVSHVDMVGRSLWVVEQQREGHTGVLTIAHPTLSVSYHAPFKGLTYIISFNYLKVIISLHI